MLPSKSIVLERSEGLASGAFIRYNLMTLIPDFYDVDRVVKENDYGEYDGNCDFTMEGSTLVLDRYDEDDGVHYTVLYKPSIERVSAQTDDNQVLEIPDNIASYIPYFIKGDLYRDDEPNEASEARNWYEQAMDEIMSKQNGKSGRVRQIYSQTE